MGEVVTFAIQFSNLKLIVKVALAMNQEEIEEENIKIITALQEK